MSIASSFLKKEGEARIDQFIVKMVATVTPPALLTTNVVTVETNVTEQATLPAPLAEAMANNPSLPETNKVQVAGGGVTNEVVLPKFARNPEVVQARREASKAINQFIQNTRSGALGVTGSILLIFAAISLLSRIEDTFNDIWGVAQGRSWFMRIVLYWGVITLSPILLVVAIGLASGPHFAGTRALLTAMPFIGHLAFQLLPIVVLCLTFSLIYMLMPNTKVHWRAAVVGGAVGGLLFHFNNLMNVLYVSRVVSNSKIYGSLALVPVFMIGLYFGWLILLFGAQVAYAWQNRATYFEEKQVENINQRGKEFVALRLATLVGQYYLTGKPAPTATQMAMQLAVPTRLIRQIMQTLCAARLIVETAGAETAYLPARPMETITCHDILNAIRANQGQELSTRDEPTRAEVYGEFERIQEAERRVASSVSMLALAHRAQRQLEDAGEAAPLELSSSKKS
jgi:membrane protein